MPGEGKGWGRDRNSIEVMPHINGGISSAGWRFSVM